MAQFIALAASDSHEFAAYRAEPEGPSRGAVVVIQEIFGVNSHIRAVTDGFAAEGYIAVAPALFDRIEGGIELDYDPDSVARGRELKAKMDWDGPLRDIRAAVESLAGSKVAVVGYCWGGSLAWLAATRFEGLAAAVCYYGGQIREFSEETPRCPVLMHFGSQDQGIPLADVEAIRASHPELPIHVYEGAGHGFNCDQRASYDRAAAATARQRTMEFLAATLG